MTKMQLMAMLFATCFQAHAWKRPSGRIVYGQLRAIEREDGSGSSFNVTIWNQESNRAETVYVTTID